MIEGKTTPGKVKMFNALVYGPPKTGKTKLGSTMPSPLFIVSEREMSFLTVGKVIDYVIIETWNDVERVISEIEQGKRAVQNQSIVLDSSSDLTKPLIDHILKIAGKNHMTIGEWGLARSYLQNIIFRLTRVIGKTKHVLVIAKAVVEKDDILKVTIGKPDTIGKYADTIGGDFDMVLVSECSNLGGKSSYKLHSTNFMQYKAGDGLGVLDAVEPNDFNVLYGKILSSIERSKIAK